MWDRLSCRLAPALLLAACASAPPPPNVITEPEAFCREYIQGLGTLDAGRLERLTLASARNLTAEKAEEIKSYKSKVVDLTRMALTTLLGETPRMERVGPLEQNSDSGITTVIEVWRLASKDVYFGCALKPGIDQDSKLSFKVNTTLDDVRKDLRQFRAENEVPST